jgi:hypothetical protein
VLDDGGEHARRVIYSVLMILPRHAQLSLALPPSHHLPLVVCLASHASLSPLLH